MNTKTKVILALSILFLIFYVFSIDYENKMQIALHDGFGVVMSYLPKFNSKNDYKHYYDLVDELRLSNKSISSIQGNKISLKIRQLGPTEEEQLKNFLNIVDYASKNNVFIWISTTTLEDIEAEYDFYKQAIKAGFSKIGITLAANHPNMMSKLETIINEKGHIRLVKGYYSSPLSKDWESVSKIFEEAADKVLRSGYYHTIATHDFDILSRLHQKYGQTSSWSKIEFGFFYSARDYVKYQIERTHIDFQHKSLYIPYGRVFPYFMSNVALLDWQNIIPRKWNALLFQIRKYM